MFKKIAVRFLALAVMVVAMNFLYIQFFLEGDLQAHSPIINSLRAIPKETTVLYFGESSNTSFSVLDEDTNSISQMLDNLLPNETVSDITKSAAHAGIYKVLLKNVSESANIHTIIITMNMRSFNGDWIYSELESSLQKEILLLKKRPQLYNRFMLSFKGYRPLNERKRFEQINNWQDTISIQIKDYPSVKNLKDWKEHIIDNWQGTNFATKQLALNFTNTFGFNINFENDPRINDFDKIVAISKERNCNLIFHILPENIETMRNLVGEDLVKMVQNNAEKLTDYYNSQGVTVLNNISLNGDKEFSDKAYPTEHYFENGRMTIAKEIKIHFAPENN